VKEQEDALNWLRQSKDPSADTPDGEFQKIDQSLPVKKGQSPKGRARDIESALDYCRNEGMIPDKFDGSVASLDKVGSVPSSRKSPEERLTDVDDIFNWIRSGKPSDVDFDGADVDELKSLTEPFL